MAGATSSVEGLLADFMTPILPKIGGEPTREGLIEVHQLISGSVASMPLNLGGSRYGYFAPEITDEEYMEQTGFVFVPPHNPGN